MSKESQKKAAAKWYQKNKKTIAEKRKGNRHDEHVKYYTQNKEKILTKQKEWALNNPEKIKAALQKYRDSNREKRLYWNIKSRAIKKQLEFNLDISDIIIPKICPYLQVPLVYKDKNYTPSIDRIDNTKGYIKGNIEIISLLANKMKNIATKEQLITFAKSIINKNKDYE